MPAPNRLQELLRQRALLHEHLAWLDREIAEASGAPAAPASAPPQKPIWPPATLATPAARPALVRAAYVASQAAQILSPPSPEKWVAESSVVTPADEILEQYRVEPDSMKSDVKKGCFIYFFGALALFAVGVGVLYFIFNRSK